MTDGAAVAETHRLTAQQWENAYKDLHRKHAAFLEALMALGPRKITPARIIEIRGEIERKEQPQVRIGELLDLLNVCSKVIYLTEKEKIDGTAEGS